MTLSPSEAADALKEIRTMESRSATLLGYERASPYLLIWGVIWAIGYSVSFFAPAWMNVGWLSLSVMGTIAGIIAAKRQNSSVVAGSNPSAKFFGIFAVVFLYVVATLVVMAPTDPRQVGAFAPLVLALLYGVFGILKSPRLAVAGGLIGVLTLVGYFALPAYFLLWMAAVGGGGLFLGGLWLRRV